MKKFIAMICLALAAGQSVSAPLDLYMNQLSLDGTGYLNRQMSVPNGGVGVDGVLYYNGTTQLPMIATFATGCSIAFGTLTCTGAPQTNADWNATSGVAQILNKPTLATVATTGAFADLVSKPTTLSGYGITDAYPLSGNPSSFITQAGARSAISLTTTGSGAATYNNTTGILNVPTPALPAAASQSAATRALNTAFQVSATRGAWVTYSVQITVTASIAGGQNGDVVLEIASDAGFTSNVQTLAVSGVGQTYTLAIALQGVQPQTSPVTGYVPAGYYARLRTVSNTGTPGFLYRVGQEVLM